MMLFESQKVIGWTAMKCVTNIHVPLRMNGNHLLYYNEMKSLVSAKLNYNYDSELDERNLYFIKPLT